MKQQDKADEKPVADSLEAFNNILAVMQTLDPEQQKRVLVSAAIFLKIQPADYGI